MYRYLGYFWSCPMIVQLVGHMFASTCEVYAMELYVENGAKVI